MRPRHISILFVCIGEWIWKKSHECCWIEESFWLRHSVTVKWTHRLKRKRWFILLLIRHSNHNSDRLQLCVHYTNVASDSIPTSIVRNGWIVYWMTSDCFSWAISLIECVLSVTALWNANSTDDTVTAETTDEWHVLFLWVESINIHFSWLYACTQQTKNKKETCVRWIILYWYSVYSVAKADASSSFVIWN